MLHLNNGFLTNNDNIHNLDRRRYIIFLIRILLFFLEYFIYFIILILFVIVKSL